MGNKGGDQPMTTKEMLAERRLRFVQGALVKLERDLESAEGSRKELLRRCVTVVEQMLRRLNRHTLH
jgi:hypothetical protein